MNCKVCGNGLYTKRWHSEFGIEEYIKRCDRCGFLEHWSYGYLELALGNKLYFYGSAHAYSSESDKRELDLAEVKFKNAIKRTRKYYKRSGNFLR